MCQSCYDGARRPWALTPIVTDAVRAVGDLYARRAAGGALHIVTDDGNLDDRSVEWCLEHLHEYERDPEAAAISFEVGLLYRVMSTLERWTAQALVFGYDRG